MCLLKAKCSTRRSGFFEVRVEAFLFFVDSASARCLTRPDQSADRRQRRAEAHLVGAAGRRPVPAAPVPAAAAGGRHSLRGRLPGLGGGQAPLLRGSGGAADPEAAHGQPAQRAAPGAPAQLGGGAGLALGQLHAALGRLQLRGRRASPGQQLLDAHALQVGTVIVQFIVFTALFILPSKFTHSHM